jgi:two-component system phosphate regulon sensor histidine kinase PhoR
MRSSLAEQIDTIASQRKNLATVVNNLREGVIAVDNKCHVVIINTAARGLLQIEEENTTDQSLQNLVRIPDAIDAVNRTLATGEVVHRHVYTKINEISVTLELTSVPVTSQGGGINALLVMRDITEQSRMAAVKSEFVANASHELRTPLATIRAAVDSLNNIEHDDITAFKKFVDILNRHTLRLELMTNDLLDLHLVEKDLEKLNITNTSIDSLEEWVIDQFSQKAKEQNIELRTVSDGDKSSFNTDEKLLHLIIQNLVDNAIKFTSPEGIVECSFTIFEGSLKVRVKDTGCGIPPDLKDRVFERFFQIEPSRTGDSAVRGTGLGLAIVKHAAERLGASIELTSEPGDGTTFEISIPESL